VARASGASLSSVVRWFQAFRRTGAKGLKPQPTPGRPCRLSGRQHRQLEKLLLQGAQAAGYSTDLWTLRRISKLIENHFGVRYTTSAVWRLLVADLHWSTQKPVRKATQRDEAAIEEWKKRQWSQIKKNASAGRPPRLRRRKRLFADPDCSQNLGTQRQDALAVPQLPQRSYLHDLCPDCISATR
jgi:transposase